MILISFTFSLLAFANQSTTDLTNSCQHDETAFHCVKYVKNYDADTITVDIPNVHPLIGKQIGVRVAHIDTPEIKTKDSCEKAVGRIAQRLIENLLTNAKRVDLINVNRDKYFRVLADVYVDGKSIKDILLKNKLAYPYEGGKKKRLDWCNIKQ